MLLATAPVVRHHATVPPSIFVEMGAHGVQPVVAGQSLVKRPAQSQADVQPPCAMAAATARYRATMGYRSCAPGSRTGRPPGASPVLAALGASSWRAAMAGGNWYSP